MVELTNKEFFQDLDQTIAAQLFEQTTYPWEILPLIKDFCTGSWTNTISR